MGQSHGLSKLQLANHQLRRSLSALRETRSRTSKMKPSLFEQCVHPSLEPNSEELVPIGLAGMRTSISSEIEPVQWNQDDQEVTESLLADYAARIRSVSRCPAKWMGKTPQEKREILRTHRRAYVEFSYQVNPFANGDADETYTIFDVKPKQMVRDHGRIGSRNGVLKELLETRRCCQIVCSRVGVNCCSEAADDLLALQEI